MQKYEKLEKIGEGNWLYLILTVLESFVNDIPTYLGQIQDI